MPKPATDERPWVTRAQAEDLLAKPAAAWTGADIRTARDFLRLGKWFVSQTDLADLMGMAGADRDRTVRRWEDQDKPRSPAVPTVLQYILRAVLYRDPELLLPQHRHLLAPLFGEAPARMTRRPSATKIETVEETEVESSPVESGQNAAFL